MRYELARGAVPPSRFPSGNSGLGGDSLLRIRKKGIFVG